MAKLLNNSPTYYLVDDQNPTGYAQVLAEFNTLSNAPSVFHTWGLTLISSKRISGNLTYFGYDGPGSIRYVLDHPAAATILSAFDYDAYGNLLAGAPTDANLYRYTAHAWDPRPRPLLSPRQILPTHPRPLWTMDTDGGDQQAPLSLHNYLYCRANPVNHRDPSGHDIEGALGVMDMMSAGFGMRSPVIGSGRGIATAIAQGIGGPDVKGILDRTLNDVEATFNNTWRTRQKQDAAAMIGGGRSDIANSWDITELRNVDPLGQICFMSATAISVESAELWR